MLERYLKMILNSRVYDVALETPLVIADRLSGRLGNTVWFKREDLQPVHSFKLRGAYNKNAYDDAYAHAVTVAQEKGMTFIHPYDDPEVIAGQGTIALEILREHKGDLHAIFVPVGGGGLIAGIAVCVKALQPSIKVIGVEPDDSPCLFEALKQKRRVLLDQVGIFTDGVAVRQAGKEPYRIARHHVDDVILVSTDEICAAMKDIFDECRSVVEPAGALAVAGIKKYVERSGTAGAGLVAINSGANINFDRLRHVSERAEIGEYREALLAVTIPEEPGSFRRFCQALGKRGITEFNYRYADTRQAHVFAGVKLNDGEKERHAIIGRLCAEGYPVEDLTDSEIAKLHIRYMVGGHAVGLKDEVLYRFQFPERPGALLEFLTSMGKRWNISLFHYRNHGADYGRVLVGIQVPAEGRKEFQRFLDDLGYRYWEESESTAYRLFLGES
jgi:threonine dehydratase